MKYTLFISFRRLLPCPSVLGDGIGVRQCAGADYPPQGHQTQTHPPCHPPMGLRETGQIRLPTELAYKCPEEETVPRQR